MQKNTITSALIFIAIIALVIFGFTFLNNNVADDTVKKDGAQNDEFMIEDYPQISSGNPVVTLRTNMGDISLELYMDRAPITVGNFIKLSEEGFYNGTKFHRVINNFMIQGGDPNSKGDDVTLYGRGGPGYTIEDEFDAELSNLRGTIAMANVGQPNSGGSQFFINHINNLGLDFNKQPFTSKHPVFGHVLKGIDVVDAIASTPAGLGDIPESPVVINEVVITYPDGYEKDSSEVTEEE